MGEDMLSSQEAAQADEEGAVAEDLSGFDPIEVLGADLACSACELTLDVLIKNYGLTESVIRRKLEEEAAAKEKAASEDEGEGKEEKEDADSKGDEEEVESDDGEESDGNDEKDEKDKKGKKSKKSKKNKKSKKKADVKVEPKAVASAVMDTACTAADFDTVTTIGTYPGRRYDQYGGVSYKAKK